MRQSHITFKQFNLTVNNKKFRSNRLEFQPSFIVKLLFITVLQSRGACFREQSKFFKSGNLFVIYLDKLSIYKWTEPWNIKGRFPESWGLRASVSSSPLPLPLPFFLLPLQGPAITRLETLATQLATQATLKLMLETPLWKQLLSLTMKGGGGGRGVSSRVLRFTSYESNIYVFTLAQIKVVQNVKNVTLVPFCKTECFDYILAS